MSFYRKYIFLDLDYLAEINRAYLYIRIFKSQSYKKWEVAQLDRHGTVNIKVLVQQVQFPLEANFLLKLIYPSLWSNTKMTTFPTSRIMRKHNFSRTCSHFPIGMIYWSNVPIFINSALRFAIPVTQIIFGKLTSVWHVSNDLTLCPQYPREKFTWICFNLVIIFISE